MLFGVYVFFIFHVVCIVAVRSRVAHRNVSEGGALLAVTLQKVT